MNILSHTIKSKTQPGMMKAEFLACIKPRILLEMQYPSAEGPEVTNHLHFADRKQTQAVSFLLRLQDAHFYQLSCSCCSRSTTRTEQTLQSSLQTLQFQHSSPRIAAISGTLNRDSALDI